MPALTALPRADRPTSRAWLRPAGLVFALLIAATAVFPVLAKNSILGILVYAALGAWIIGCYQVAGNTSRGRQAWIFLWCAVLWAAQFLSAWDAGPAAFLSALGTAAFWAVGAWVAFNYPADLSSTKAERFYVSVFAVYITGTTVISLLTSRPEWLGLNADSWWPSVFESAEIHRWNVSLWPLLDIASAVAFLVLMAFRFRRMAPLDRLDSGILVAGVSGLAVVGAGHSASQTWYSSDVEALLPLMGAALFVPLALLVGNHKARREALRITTEVQERLCSDFRSLGEIEVILRDALRNDTIRLVSSNELASTGDTHILGVLESETRMDPLLVVGGRELQRHQLTISALLGALSLGIQLNGLRELKRRDVDSSSLPSESGIRRDLHDDVQQRLLAIGIRLKLAEASAGLEMKALLSDVTDDVRATLASVRKIAHGCIPAELSELGMARALKGATDGLGVAVVIDVDDSSLPERVQSILYYVACEAINNVVKHAHASRLWVLVKSQDGIVKLTVRDDGIGIPANSQSRGLGGMRKRLADAGGDLAVSVDGGTAIVACVPLGPCR